MKLGNALAILVDLRYAIQTAIWPTFSATFRKPILLLNPVQLSRIFMAHVWTLFGNPTDENGRDVKNILLSNATGVVIDIGAGQFYLILCVDK